jgi:hypothetical protein
MRRLLDVLEQEYELDLNGWTLAGVGGISPDGTAIVGSGINPLGQDEAWLVTIPEQPFAAPLPHMPLHPAKAPAPQPNPSLIPA